MLEILLKATLARTFMAIKAQKLRSLWLKKQLIKYIEENGGNLDEYYINWNKTKEQLYNTSYYTFYNLRSLIATRAM